MSESMNKFERTRLLGARAAEIAAGAQPKVNVDKEEIEALYSRDYVKIAQKEYEEGVLDLELYKEK